MIEVPHLPTLTNTADADVLTVVLTQIVTAIDVLGTGTIDGGPAAQ